MNKPIKNTPIDTADGEHRVNQYVGQRQHHHQHDADDGERDRELRGIPAVAGRIGRRSLAHAGWDCEKRASLFSSLS
jgi:hypothetical protein